MKSPTFAKRSWFRGMPIPMVKANGTTFPAGLPHQNGRHTGRAHNGDPTLTQPQRADQRKPSRRSESPPLVPSAVGGEREPKRRKGVGTGHRGCPPFHHTSLVDKATLLMTFTGEPSFWFDTKPMVQVERFPPRSVFGRREHLSKAPNVSGSMTCLQVSPKTKREEG